MTTTQDINKTIAEINKTTSKMGGGLQQLSPLSEKSSSTSSEPNEKTIGEIMGGAGTDNSNLSEDDFLKKYNYVDEGKIRSDVLSRYQDEINASKSAYASLLADQQKLGQGRLGESTAMQARSGLMGSDFGAAQTEGTRKYNLDQENTVLESQATALGSIMARANEEASNEITNRRAAKSAGHASYVEYMKDAKSTKAENMSKLAKTLILRNINPNAISVQELKNLARSYGSTTQDIINAYLIEKDTQDVVAAEAAQKGQFDLSEGGARYDAQGNMIASRAKTYAPKETDKNELLSVTEANAAGVPYGTTKQQLIDKQATATTDTSKSMSQIELAKKSLKNAKDLAGSSGSTSWFTGARRAISGATPIDNLTAETNTLRSNILTMATDPAIKKFFGPQMSNADVQLMTAAGTTLNPELQSPEQMKEELARLEDFINRAEEALKKGQAQTSNSPETSGQVIVSGVLYNVDSNGDMTPAN